MLQFEMFHDLSELPDLGDGIDEKGGSLLLLPDVVFLVPNGRNGHAPPHVHVHVLPLQLPLLKN